MSRIRVFLLILAKKYYILAKKMYKLVYTILKKMGLVHKSRDFSTALSTMYRIIYTKTSFNL